MIRKGSLVEMVLRFTYWLEHQPMPEEVGFCAAFARCLFFWLMVPTLILFNILAGILLCGGMLLWLVFFETGLEAALGKIFLALESWWNRCVVCPVGKIKIKKE